MTESWRGVGEPASQIPSPEFLSLGDFVYRWTPVPVFVESSGSRLRDSDGFVYLDAEAANGAAVLGYDPTILAEAVGRVGAMPALPSFCESDARLRVARRLERFIGEAVGRPGRVAFELGGAQGIELAMRVAAAAGGVSQIITFEGAYHGRSPYTAQFSASRRYRQLLGTGMAEVHRLPYPDCSRCPHGQQRSSCHHECVEFVRRLGRDDVTGLSQGIVAGAAPVLILEPVLNAGGMVLPDSHHIREVVAHFRGMGALVVVDEVFTGFYRTGRRWGFQLHDIEPDIVVASKGLTNGIGALSCVWAREPLMSPDRFPPGTHSSTYAGSVLMLAVAETMLDRFEAWSELQTRLQVIERRLGALVARLEQRSPLVQSGYAVGGTGRVRLTGPHATLLRRTALTIGRDRPVDGIYGVLLASTGMSPDVIALHPPLTIGDEELSAMAELIEGAFSAVGGVARPG